MKNKKEKFLKLYAYIVSFGIGFILTTKTLGFPYETFSQNLNYILWSFTFILFFLGLRGYLTNKKILTKAFWNYFLYYEYVLTFVFITISFFQPFTPDTLITIFMVISGIYLIYQYSRNAKIWEV